MCFTIGRILSLTLMSLIVLVGCNGNGGIDGTGNGPQTLLRGIAASAIPLSESLITIKGSMGGSKTVTSAADGSFSVDVAELKPPFFLKVNDGSQAPLYSVATQTGDININPFTHFVAENWFSSRSRNIEAVFNSNTEISSPPLKTEIDGLGISFNRFLNPAYIDYAVAKDFDFQHAAFNTSDSDFYKLLQNTHMYENNGRFTFTLSDPVNGFQSTILNDYDVHIDLASLNDTQAPTFTSTPAAFSASASQVVILWNEASDNIGVAGYQIYRDDNPSGFPKTTAFPFYVDSGLSTGTQYCYSVVAFDAAGGSSAKSSQVCVTPTAVDNQAPSAV